MRKLTSDSMRIGEFTNPNLYATDIAPPCTKCQCTIALYLVDQEPDDVSNRPGHVTIQCVHCQAVDLGFFFPARYQGALFAGFIRKLHEDYRNEPHYGEPNRYFEVGK